MMQVQVTQEDDLGMTLRISHSHTDFVNSLRRSIMHDVPTLAISRVHVKHNNSVMADEFLAHRLGLLPIVCPEPPPGDDAEAATHEETFRLDIEGPYTVTAADLQHDSLRMAYPGTPLVVLGKQQRLVIDAVARWGTGKTHARFIPVCPVTYRFIADIDVTDIEDLAGLRALCPVGVFGEDGTVDADKCTFCGECTSRDAAAKARVSVRPRPGVFEMRLRTTGAMPPRVVLTRAIASLQHKVKDVEQLVQVDSDGGGAVSVSTST